MCKTSLTQQKELMLYLRSGGNLMVNKTSLTINKKYIIEILRNLIKTKPINPPGQEEEAALVIKEELEKLGAKTTLDYVKPKRPNVIGTFGGEEGKGTTLLFNGHTDVVPPGPNWTMDPFEGIVKDGKVYGRGAVDMLGGLAATLGAIKAVIDSGYEFKGRLLYTAVIAEETGGEGAIKLVKDGIKADYAYVSEPSDLEIRIAERGLIWFKIKCIGEAAHASMPHLGINAIEVLTKALLAIKDIKYDYEPHEFLGYHTFNIGLIKGGVKTNIVAPECEATIDIRTPPSLSFKTVEEKIRNVLKNFEEIYGAKFDLQVIAAADPFELDKNSEIVRFTCEAFKEALDMEPRIGGMFGATDGRFFVKAGIPTVILGPGPEDNAHKADEYVEIDSLVKLAKIYTQIILKTLT